MKITLDRKDIESEIIGRLERISGEEFKKCYQCGNCSAGCPVSYEMEVQPTQVMRLLQLGRVEELQKANSMWVCVGCLQCYSRCPKGVSVANTLEALRQVNLRHGEGRIEIKEVGLPFLKTAPQQAIVAGFRKLVG